MSRLQDVIVRGTRAAQPAANAQVIGTLYFVTDENVIERSDGTNWQSYSPAVFTGDSGSGGLKGLVPTPAAGDAGLGKYLAADGTWSIPPGTSLPINIKQMIAMMTETNVTTGIKTTGATNYAGINSLSAIQDTVSSWLRDTSAAANGANCGFRNSVLEGPMFAHKPTIWIRIRTGSVITVIRFWIGLFDSTNQSANPGTNATGVNTAKHVAFRYVTGTDTQWTASVADGTTQSTVGVANVAASTEYVLRIRFISNTQVGFSVNGGTEQTRTLASNAGDTTPTTLAAYLWTAEAVAKSFDFASIFAQWS